jgi:hypothetical protein
MANELIHPLIHPLIPVFYAVLLPTAAAASVEEMPRSDDGLAGFSPSGKREERSKSGKGEGRRVDDREAEQQLEGCPGEWPNVSNGGEVIGQLGQMARGKGRAKQKGRGRMLS